MHSVIEELKAEGLENGVRQRQRCCRASGKKKKAKKGAWGGFPAPQSLGAPSRPTRSSVQRSPALSPAAAAAEKKEKKSKAADGSDDDEEGGAAAASAAASAKKRKRSDADEAAEAPAASSKKSKAEKSEKKAKSSKKVKAGETTEEARRWVSCRLRFDLN